jgi:hypothetical protein
MGLDGYIATFLGALIGYAIILAIYLIAIRRLTGKWKF